MPLFFLHQRGGDQEFADEDGQELACLEAAQALAISGIRSILADEIMHGYLSLHERIDIEDASGRCLLSLSFREAFQQRD